MGIIIAAHAGTGKTHFARENPQIAVDLTYNPCNAVATYYYNRYGEPEGCLILSDDVTEHEVERGIFRMRTSYGNNDYPQNYIDAIKSAMGERKFIFIVPARLMNYQKKASRT